MLFTNFSAYETSDGSGDISFDEDDEEVKKDPQEEQKSSDDPVSFETLTKKFREDLVVKLMEDQSIKNKSEALKIVDKCLPCENFFAFKNIKGMSSE